MSFEHRYKGPKISLSLPPHSGEKIMWLNLCIVYSIVSENIMDNFELSVEITNESKKISWSYFSSFIGIPGTKSNTMMWLIHWPVSHRRLEGGDHMSCQVEHPALEIRDVGIAYGYESNNITYECDLQHFCTGNENSARNAELQQLMEGFVDLGSTGNLQVQVSNHLADSKRIASLQVLYQPTISGFWHSGFLPRHIFRVIPRMYRYSYHAYGPKICFKVPPNSSQKISWLKSAILLFASGGGKTASEILLRFEIFNETKQTKWTYFKSFEGTPEAKCTYIIWLNSWKFTGELESGDNVSLTVLSDLPVVEYGVDLVYEPNGNDVIHNSANFVFFETTFIYLLFISQRNLYRMEGPVLMSSLSLCRLCLAPQS